MSDADNGKSNKSQSTSPVFVTRLGIQEHEFMRTAKKGNYTPTVHEIEDLVINAKINMNDARVLYFIKSKTVNFWNTEVRLKRKDIEEKLNMKKFRVAQSIKFLTENNYLIEKKDKDDYYFYGLNPYTFDGLFIVKSVQHGTTRLNRNLKPISMLQASKPESKGHKMLPIWTQNVLLKGTKCGLKDDLTIRNYSAFEMLKYTLLKYTLLNGFSEARGELIQGIIGEIKNPEYLIKQLVALIQAWPSYGRAITDELVRAHSNRTDAFNKPLKTNALAYLVSCWNDIKVHFQNVPHHSLDMSDEIVTHRKELADLIAEYPIDMNQPGKVMQFKRA